MQAQTPPAPPSPVVIERGKEAKAFAAFPKVNDGGKHFVVLGINVTGDVKLVENARLMLAADGWPASYVRDRLGNTVLSIGAENRTPQAIAGLGRRLMNHEFGDVEASLFSIPDPSLIR